MTKIKAKISNLKIKAKELKGKLTLLYLAYKHPKTPWYAKLIAIMTLIYAFSPIDLIPDFIPVLGYLDDLLLIPAGITLSFKLIPVDVIKECEMRSIEERINLKGRGIIGGLFIILIWLFIIYFLLKKLNIVK